MAWGGQGQGGIPSTFMRDSLYLFSEFDWHSVDQNQRARMNTEIQNLDSNYLLNTPVEDLCNYFYDKYKIEVPTLKKDEIVADQHEIKTDVSQDPFRHISDRSRPFFIQGTAIVITIPFDGESDAFKIRPTTFTLNPPRAEITGNSLSLTIEGTNLNAERVKRDVDRSISDIETLLTTLRANSETLNSQLKPLARTALNHRREKLLADRNLVGSLGFKMKERPGKDATYAAPEVRRKITPSLPKSSSVPFKPEPALSDSDYQHILKVIQGMAHVMERSPSAFSSMDEESLRTHFLVQLNGQYDGQATGETFNHEGKTDILIRSEDKNIFIAECKFWSGPAKFTETLDQIQRYSSWRDTKVAVIIFNRNKNLSKVLDAVEETAVKHPNYKRAVGLQGETSFRYIFSHKNDSSREMTITVMLFDVPS